MIQLPAGGFMFSLVSHIHTHTNTSGENENRKTKQNKYVICDNKTTKGFFGIQCVG